MKLAILLVATLIAMILKIDQYECYISKKINRSPDPCSNLASYTSYDALQKYVECTKLKGYVHYGKRTYPDPVNDNNGYVNDVDVLADNYFYDDNLL